MKRDILLGVLATSAFAVVAGTAHADAEVTVVHGIPGVDLDVDPSLPVDVSVSGACALPGFTFGQIVGGIELPAGEYDIAISLANVDEPCGNDPVIEALGVVLEDEVNYSIVAHLDTDGAPTASVFENRTETSRLRATLNVFHTAAAPSVDIVLERNDLRFVPDRELEDVLNGDKADLQLFFGDWDVSIFPSESNFDDGDDEDEDDEDEDEDEDSDGGPAFGPLTVDLERDTAYLVFAVGSLTNETFTLLLSEVKTAPDPASVYVVHGINGLDLGADETLPVDVSVNGECALKSFTFGDIVGPLPLPAGDYDIAISLANADDPCGNDPVIQADGVALEGGESYSILAHLNMDSAPTASVFVNNLHANGAFARVNVYHGAVAPSVDVRFKRNNPWWLRARFLRDLMNGEGDDLRLFRGRYRVSLRPAGESDTVFGPATLQLKRRTAYLVFAVGSLSGGTLDFLVEEVPTDE